jgi:hypothetical protein
MALRASPYLGPGSHRRQSCLKVPLLTQTRRSEDSCRSLKPQKRATLNAGALRAKGCAVLQYALVSRY